MSATQTRSRVRPAHPGDLRATAALHARGLELGLFPRLGPRFLQAYHDTFLRSPYGTVLVVERDGGDVVGMLVGTTANRRHYRWVVRERGLVLAMSLLRGLLGHPTALALFLRTRVRRYLRAARRLLSGRDEHPATGRARQVAVLSHVVVDASARGHGLGATLVEQFLDEARAAGAEQAMLVTAEDGSAADFYRRLGWRDHGVRRGADGYRVRRFELDLR